MRPEDWLDELLLSSDRQPVPDDGFTAAVMRRVHALPPPLQSAQALARVRECRRLERRQTRWSLGGAALGMAIALAIARGGDAPAVAAGGPWTHWAVPLAALAVSSAVLALLALRDALDSSAR
jgi:hypothetical protein